MSGGAASPPSCRPERMRRTCTFSYPVLMTFPDDAGTHDPPERPAYRVPIGIPLRDEGRRQGAIVSVLIHAAIIALLLMPIVFAHTVITRIDQGAGGAGPAGGGGGGSGQGARETLRFIRVTRRSCSHTDEASAGSRAGGAEDSTTIAAGAACESARGRDRARSHRYRRINRGWHRIRA